MGTQLADPNGGPPVEQANGSVRKPLFYIVFPQGTLCQCFNLEVHVDPKAVLM